MCHFNSIKFCNIIDFVSWKLILFIGVGILAEWCLLFNCAFDFYFCYNKLISTFQELN